MNKKELEKLIERVQDLNEIYKRICSNSIKMDDLAICDECKCLLFKGDAKQSNCEYLRNNVNNIVRIDHYFCKKCFDNKEKK